jgi:hypothetical protein
MRTYTASSRAGTWLLGGFGLFMLWQLVLVIIRLG